VETRQGATDERRAGQCRVDVQLRPNVCIARLGSAPGNEAYRDRRARPTGISAERAATSQTPSSSNRHVQAMTSKAERGQGSRSQGDRLSQP
jgi:hypothetical protein